MEVRKMNPVRISPYASAKVMFDHFPTINNEQMFIDAQANSQDVAMSAGALCLYAATLLTKVHENQPQTIEGEFAEREQALKDLISKTPKYAIFSNEKIETMAHNLILRDIRNCFAHGNFEIGYNIHSKRLYYILRPKRKDFVVDQPIIISKDALFAANRRYIGKLGTRYMILSPEEIEQKVKNNFGTDLKEFVLPIDMLRLAENYLDGKMDRFRRYRPREGRYLPLYYPLLVSQMTYEQDDYYNMFNRESNIFGKISHIRNAISHNGFEFDNQTFDITHIDRNSSTTDPLEKSVRMLKLVRDHKNLASFSKQLNFRESDTQYLIDNIKSFFDSLFVYGGYEQESEE